MYHKMHDHWKYNGPPVYVAVAAYLELTQERPKAASDNSTTNMTGSWDDLLSQFASSGGMIQ